MSDHVIAPPPSLEEILSQEERIGTVDFSRRLVAVPEPQAPVDAAPAPQAPAEPAAAQVEEAAPQAEVEEHELVSVGAAPERSSDRADRSGQQSAVPSAGRGRGKGGKQRGRGSRATGSEVREGDSATGETSAQPEHRPGHRLEAVATDAPEVSEAEVHAAADRETVARLTDPASIAWLTRAPGPGGAEDHGADDPDDFLVAPPAGFVPGSGTGPAAQAAALLSLVPAEDMATVTEDVDDVVAGVIARIQEVRSATIAHLEAIEIEAAMRCEMLTAQAELDAELIRLHARREAHAIIAAARARSGLPPVATDDAARLDRVEAATTRLVDTLEEQDLPSGPPDHEPRT